MFDHSMTLFPAIVVSWLWNMLWIYSDQMMPICIRDMGHYTPLHNEVVGGYIGFTPSVRPSVPHPVSALCRLQFWMDPFHIYISSQATSEGVSRLKLLAKFQNLNFWQFKKKLTLTLSSFDLGSGVNHYYGQSWGGGGISEHRRSSCSSWLR